MLFCSFFETANSPTLQSLSVLAPLWGFRQPGDFSGHIMKHDPLPCESVSELKPLQLFPAYSHITKKTNYKVIKLPSHWCSTLSMINTFFPVFYSAQEHPQAAPLSSVSSCLDGRIWGFGFESPPPVQSSLLRCTYKTDFNRADLAVQLGSRSLLPLACIPRRGFLSESRTESGRGSEKRSIISGGVSTEVFPIKCRAAVILLESCTGLQTAVRSHRDVWNFKKLKYVMQHS